MSSIRSFHWWVARILLPPFFTAISRLRRRGVGNIPRSGAVLFVSNHVSNLDPPLVATAARCRRMHFMAKKELFRNRFAAYVISGLGAFPVDRGGADRAAMRTAREVLEEGGALLMFPEGTRSRDGRLARAWPGAGSLALLPGVTVVPTAIWGSQHRWGPATVVFGPPVDLSDIEAGPRSARAQAAVDRIMEEVARLRVLAGAPSEPPAMNLSDRGGMG